MSLENRVCENGDGNPAKFLGYGRLLCWDCYYVWLRGEAQAKPQQLSFDTNWTQRRGD